MIRGTAWATSPELLRWIAEAFSKRRRTRTVGTVATSHLIGWAKKRKLLPIRITWTALTLSPLRTEIYQHPALVVFDSVTVPVDHHPSSDHSFWWSGWLLWFCNNPHLIFFFSIYINSIYYGFQLIYLKKKEKITNLSHSLMIWNEFLLLSYISSLRWRNM